ncbi:MAG: hypothetical protein PHQ20_03240 [Candidatus Moranbacteria bacterium]|nr:hypothetical protein [Candidatus Moranbacteria bacterium]
MRQEETRDRIYGSFWRKRKCQDDGSLKDPKNVGPGLRWLDPFPCRKKQGVVHSSRIIEAGRLRKMICED